MGYYSRETTENLKKYEINLSKPSEFTGNCAGVYEAYEGRNADNYRRLKEIQTELKRREDNPGIYEREMKALEENRKRWGW